MTQRYVKKDQISHILDRPDMYVGSTRPRALEEYVVDGDNFKIKRTTITYAPAILRIFVEPLSNCIDNVARSKKTRTKCTTIKITIDKETGLTTFWNDGLTIPIEIHDEEKIYNHTLIFGNLLTSSNYDDENDEREDVSGKNGLGVKCLGKDTDILLWNGEIKKVQDIKKTDVLIGEDGTPRNIVNIVNGNSKLYKISSIRGDEYTVNEDHTLTLTMPDHNVIYWNNGVWSILWWENGKINRKSMRVYNNKIRCPECNKQLYGNLKRHYTRIHPLKTAPTYKRKSPTKPDMNDDKVIKCYNKMVMFREKLPKTNIIDITVRDYLKLTKTAKSRLSGFRLNVPVKWPYREVYLDPYILGLWLGDGYSHGKAIAINTKDDYEIYQYVENWCAKNNAKISQIGKNIYAYYISNNPIVYGKKNPLSSQLSKYNLIRNKHIPQEYLVNSEDVRLQVLAGIIDSDGHVYKDKSRIVIVQSIEHTQIINDIVYLARSLGMACHTHVKKTQWNHKGTNKRGLAHVVNISGYISRIPCLIKRKKCIDTDINVTNTGKITITECDNGEFYGIQVDGNNRLLLGDFTVTHNCTSVFSKKFVVEGCDPKNKKKFKQVWRNNMKTVKDPQVVKSSDKCGYTKVSYIPDFARFGVEGYTDEILSLYYKYIVDASMITGVDVYLNDVLVPVKTVLDYAKLYNEKDTESLYIKTKNCQVVLTESDTYEVISFANGVCTPLGGTHVDAWSEGLFRPLVDKLNSPKRPQITIRDVKQCFRLFVIATVIQPGFDSQSKTKLESPIIEAEVKKTHISTICKWHVMERLEDMIRSKELVALKKVERKKRGYVKVDNLDSANFEGGRHSHECTLILVEGLSAKTYATYGIEFGAFGKKGHDWFGILALRGKVLNSRNATPKGIAKNTVITNIIQSLGLQTGVDYRKEENYRKLRYGRVLLVCDADTDGIHITALLQNMFHSLYPTILQREQAFLTSMQTPIVRVYLSKKNSIIFYDESEYREYVKEYAKKYPNKKLDKKYYKGLGSNGEEDIQESFGRKLVEYKIDENTFEAMNKAFHKKYADYRKEWLENYDPSKRVLKWTNSDYEMTHMSITDYINTELIKFSHDDCKRSIPHLMDGLKESHRKVLYATFLRNLRYTGKTLKVAQLAGYVAEKTGYHHGEQNLLSTIIGLAQSFIGSNNIPLLYRDGQFGSRLEGGKDAGNGRYIFTKLEALTRLIFRPEDDVLLQHREDDGDIVEPYFYVPIIPMILVNGISAGIGTGWSSTVPSYNPLDLIDCIKVWLDKDGSVIEDTKDGLTTLFPDIKPWYRGFTGTVNSTDDPTKYITEGNLVVRNGKYIITELPIGVWTDIYKQRLEDWMEAKQIKSFEYHSTPKIVNFVVHEHPEGFNPNKDTLKLYSTIRTTNMCMFNEREQLRKYNTVDEIIDAFCRVRLQYYYKRKKYQLELLENQIKFLGNKKRFLMEVRDGTIKLFLTKGTKRESRKTEDLVKELTEKKYDKDFGSDDNEESENKSHGYDYLLRLQFRSITVEKIDQLQNDIESTIKTRDNLQSTSEKDLWRSDLDEFTKEYTKWLKAMDNEKILIGKKPKRKK